MYKNIVFDLGNVLLTFQPQEYLSKFVKDPGLKQKLYKNIFKNREWQQLDRGTITVSQALKRMTARDRKNQELIAEIMNRWPELLQPISGTVEILKEIYYNDYSLYILSNFHKKAFDIVVKKYDFFAYFSGMIISSHVNYIKPESEIYKILIERYSLNPDRTLFIDDIFQNIQGAFRQGIHTIKFKEPSSLRKVLASKNIL